MIDLSQRDMDTIRIRKIDTGNPEELWTVTERCMTTVLETIPEFAGSEELARRSLPNFTADEMSRMIRNDFADPSKRIMVAAAGGRLIGQALYSVKVDADGKRYGFCFSRYVLPGYRRMGVASALMEDAMRWFATEGAAYVVAQTHVANVSLQKLFEKFGFAMEGPFEGPWRYVVLRKELG